MRTLKSMPEVLTAGVQARVRKVLREMGVPSRVANRRSFGADAALLDVGGQLVEEFGAQAYAAPFVVLGVGLGHVAFAGGGVLLGDLDDGLLHGHGPGEEVDVAGTQGDELTPAHAGLDRGLDQEPVGL